MANNDVVPDGPGHGVLDLKKIWGLKTKGKSVLVRTKEGVMTDLFADDGTLFLLLQFGSP